MAEALRNTLWGRAGMPVTISPGAMSLWMPALAVAMAPSPMVAWLAMPTCPAKITRLPTLTPPARPTWEAITVASPTWQPWAICIRLSSLVPRPTRVVPTAGRSMVVLPPTRTPSSITTIAGLLHFFPALGGGHKAKALGPNHRAAVDGAVGPDLAAFLNRAVGVEDGAIPHPHPWVNHHVGMNAHLIPRCTPA
jgi:hypothetical protein